jgi:putative serine protease PepD
MTFMDDPTADDEAPPADDGSEAWEASWSIDEPLPEGTPAGGPVGAAADTSGADGLNGGDTSSTRPPGHDTPPPTSLLPPPAMDVPISRALIPPRHTEGSAPPETGPPSTGLPRPGGELLPPSPLNRPDDVYRFGGEEPQDFRQGPMARPPRGRYSALPVAPEPQPQAQRLKPSKWSTVFLPFIAGAVGAGLVVGGFFLLRDGDDSPSAAPVAAEGPVTIRETVRTEFVDPEGVGADPTAVARKVIPSVVTVEVGLSDGSGGFNGTGSGSGVVLSADGYVVTNEHVVNGSDSFDVLFSDGRKYQAELLGADELTDLAVLKIEAAGLVPIDIGSTADLVIGDVAIAAGSPLGLQGGPTVTVGVISAFNREVRTGNANSLLGMLQTDAPITRGSSGGALVDAQGALIGVTSAVGVSDVGVEGIGFAIPIEVVQRITDELIANGAVEHSFLGIEGRTSLEDEADGAEVAVGVFVQAIVEDSGAAAGGIEEGDVIVAIDGTPVKTINTLVGELRRYRVGEPLDVEIMRGDETIHLTIELGKRPPDEA